MEIFNTEFWFVCVGQKLIDWLKHEKERFGLIQEGDYVVECGGAPGAWTQVLTKIIGNNVNN